MNDKLIEALEEIEMDARVMRPYVGQVARLGKIARGALAASKQEPRHKKCPKCGEAVMFVMGTECCTKNGCDWMTTTSKQEPHPPSRLCMCDDCKPSFEQDPQAQCNYPRCSCGVNIHTWDGCMASEPQSTMVDKQSTKHEPQAEPFPESNSDCKNRHQCWEPCGELGKSESHVKVHVPQAQAGEPKVVAEILRLNGVVWDVTTKPGKWKSATDDIRYTTEPLITLQSHREAMAKETEAATNAIRRLSDELFQREESIAKKDAALDACVDTKEKAEAAYHDAMDKYGISNVLTMDLRDVLAAITQAEAVSPDKANNFYLAVCNFLVWIGREGTVHADDPIIDQLSNALHDIDGGVFKDSLKWPQAEVRVPDGYVLVPVEPTGDMLHCAQDRVYSLFLVDARNIWDAMLSAAPKPQEDLQAILKKQAS